MDYPEVLKARMVRRMAGPERQSANSLAAETGIPQGTLSRWLRRAGTDVKSVIRDRHEEHKKTLGSADGQARRPRDFSAVERAQIVVEASSLKGPERGVFLRRRGLFEEHVKGWTRSLEEPLSKKSATSTMGDRRKIAELEKELRRKDKALAEAAALLVLKKKLGILLGGDEE